MEVTKEILETTTEIEQTKTFTSANLPTDACEVGEIIIEEITRNHKLLHRHRVKQSEVSIGRGYQNDIILTDPHICPAHLSLNYSQGAWHLKDNDTVNGTLLENPKGKHRHAHQQEVRDGDIIILGKSQLRILFNDHQVPETIALSPFESLIDIVRNPIAVFISIALFLLIAGHISYLNQLTETNVSQLFVSAFSLSLLFALWPAGVALVSHLTKHDPRIFAQFGISFSFFVLMWLSERLEKIIAFNSASDSNLGLVFSLLPVGLAFCLFWLNSYIGFHVSARRRVVVAASITVLLFGGSYLLQYSKKPEFSPHPQYNATIMSPGFLIYPSNNVDTFLEQSNKLFEQTTKAAKKD